jgi:hypothetical protein
MLTLGASLWFAATEFLIVKEGKTNSLSEIVCDFRHDAKHFICAYCVK